MKLEYECTQFKLVVFINFHESKFKINSSRSIQIYERHIIIFSRITGNLTLLIVNSSGRVFLVGKMNSEGISFSYLFLPLLMES